MLFMWSFSEYYRNNIHQTDIDTFKLMNTICDIFNNSLISVFKTKCENQKYKKHTEKSWYKKEFKGKINLFLQAKQGYENFKSEEKKKRALKETSISC